jgi:hypothetical protein
MRRVVAGWSADLPHHGAVQPVPSSSRRSRPVSAGRLAVCLFALAGGSVAVAACSSAPSATPPISPGSSSAPRAVNIVMRDYAYVPPVVDLVPGETVTLHVINGGLEVHEALLGDMTAQLTWESAEEKTVGAPPGPTPFISPPPDFTGSRIVAGSGQLVDVTWTVPLDAAAAPWFVGCHIPGHWAKGMVVPIRWVDSSGVPMASTPVLPSILPTPPVGG